MEQLLLNVVGNTNGLVAYGAVFIILLLCGLGVPMPEDISLILGGYLVHTGSAKLLPMMVTGFLGILVGDSIIFFAGRRVGTKVGRTPGGFFARIVTPEKRAKVEGLFARHGQKIVMIARFLPGVRAVTFFTAGSAGMSYPRFIFFDGVAALASAPVFVVLGYHFGGELEALIDAVKRGQARVVVAIALLAAAYSVYRFIRRRRVRAAQPAMATLPAGENLEAAPTAPRGTDRAGIASRARIDEPGRYTGRDRAAGMGALK
ncbi:MAG: DedA family protein [Myxococcales bacterium]|nr:DedA family protein [Myxococcales bacterium]